VQGALMLEDGSVNYPAPDPTMVISPSETEQENSNPVDTEAQSYDPSETNVIDLIASDLINMNN